MTASPPPRAFVLAPLAAQPSERARAAVTTPRRPSRPRRRVRSRSPLAETFHRPLETDRPLRVLVVGDSVGITLGRGLELWSRETGRTVVRNEARKYCSLGRYLPRIAGYGPDEQGDGCDDWQTRWARDVDDFDPDVVVVLYTIWELALRELPGATDFAGPGTPGIDAWQRSEYDTAADVLGARGANVVWLTIPCTPNYPSTPGSPTWFVNERTIAGAARDRDFVRVLDLDAQVCPNHQFRSAYGGVDPARPDGNHFSDDGALAAARWMSPILLGDVAPPTRVQRLDPPR